MKREIKKLILAGILLGSVAVSAAGIYTSISKVGVAVKCARATTASGATFELNEQLISIGRYNPVVSAPSVTVTERGEVIVCVSVNSAKE